MSNTNLRCWRTGKLIGENLSIPSEGNETAQDSSSKSKAPVSCLDNEAERDSLIVKLSSGMLMLSLSIPSSLHGRLIGVQGMTNRRIETETRTVIRYPSIDQEGDSAEIVTIKGKMHDDVVAAKNYILRLTEWMMSHTTHFICVDVTTEEVQRNFEKFKQEILEANMPDISELLFQSTVRLHLTLFCCMLYDGAKEKAVELLQTCSELLLVDMKRPFSVKLRGLEAIDTDPSAAKKLYACAEAPELQKFADQLLRTFRQEGYVAEPSDRDTVKLHMTVMNVSFRKRQQPNASKTFDAREILKRYSDFDFGTAECNAVNLNILNGSKFPQKYIAEGFFQFSN